MSGTPEVTRPPGRPALSIARIALGFGGFGGIGSAPRLFGQGLNEDQALAVMDAAWEAGITHFDTADAYGGGRSEVSIGRWIATRGVRPRLTTKTFNPMTAGADHGLAPARIARQRRASLDRLGELAAGRGISMAGLALAWLLADERVTQVVIGPDRPEHLAPVREALQLRLTGTDIADIERAVP